MYKPVPINVLIIKSGNNLAIRWDLKNKFWGTISGTAYVALILMSTRKLFVTY